MTDIEQFAATFEKFDLHDSDPKWSSWLLERLFDAVPGGDVGAMTELLRGLDLALKRNDVRLTDCVANFILDVAKTALVWRRKEGLSEQADWNWANEELARGVEAARAYLFLWVLPPDRAMPGSLLAILRGLEGTSRFDEAMNNLAEDFERPAVRRELLDWRANGIGIQAARQLDAFLQGCR